MKGTILILAALLSSALLLVSASSADRVLLKSINVLIFKNDGSMTKARRSSPVPKMACVGGNACNEHAPEVIKCTNIGTDGNDVAWACTADLPNKFRFGTTDVSCEGYSFPEDPYVLQDSCGLEYTLFWNTANHGQTTGQTHDSNQQIHHHHHHFGSGWGGYFRLPNWSFWTWAWVLVACYLSYRWVRSRSAWGRLQSVGTQYWPTGAHWPPHGNSGGHYDANGKYFNVGGERFEQKTDAPINHSTEASSSRPGFWSAAGLGAAAGYFAGKRHNNQNTTTQTQEAKVYVPPQQRHQQAESSKIYAESAPPVTDRNVVVDSREATGYGTTKRREDNHPLVAEPVVYDGHKQDEKTDEDVGSRNASGAGVTKRR